MELDNDKTTFCKGDTVSCNVKSKEVRSSRGVGDCCHTLYRVREVQEKGSDWEIWDVGIAEELKLKINVEFIIKLNSEAQQPMKAKAYCAHLSIRDLWALRCMGRCPV
ncbi:hypothetical protein TNCV_1110581 [Trichonephila clavipes]|nr:hypothetical protein TNCV_1110581 [Trichonephila clavipes]